MSFFFIKQIITNLNYFRNCKKPYQTFNMLILLSEPGISYDYFLIFMYSLAIFSLFLFKNKNKHLSIIFYAVFFFIMIGFFFFYQYTYYLQNYLIQNSFFMSYLNNSQYMNLLLLFDINQLTNQFFQNLLIWPWDFLLCEDLDICLDIHNFLSYMTEVATFAFYTDIFNNSYFIFTFSFPNLFQQLTTSFGFFWLFSFDNLSLVFIWLTISITTLCIIVSFFSFNNNQWLGIVVLLLLIQLLIILIFSTLDILLFYFLFETVLIPLFFLVGIYGSRARKIKAAFYLLFYTLIGSIPFLIGILYIIYKTGETNLFLLKPLLLANFSIEELTYLWLLIFPGFAFKMPLYPFHLWLPEAHVEAPTVGSIILAGLVLKLGGYGFIRFSIDLLYLGGIDYLFFVYWICLISMFCALFSAACQIDLKRIIAYGSISHMAFVTLCIFLGTLGGLESAVLMMLGHGFVSSSLFLLIGILYERGHTRNIRYYSGLYKISYFGLYFLLFIFCDIGIPFTPTFIAEIIGLIAIVQVSTKLALFISFALIIGVFVNLILTARLLFGLNDSRYFSKKVTIINNFLYWGLLQKNSKLHSIKPFIKSSSTLNYFINFKMHLNFIEHFVLIIFLLFTFILGILPNIFLSKIIFTLENVNLFFNFINYVNI